MLILKRMLSKYTFLAPNLIRVIGEGADYAHPPIPQSFGPSKFAPTPMMGLYCSKLESSCRYFSDGAVYAHHITACPPGMINPIQNQGGGGRLCPSQYTASPPRFKMLSKPQLTLIQAKGGRLCPSHYYENWFFHFEVFIRHTSLNVYLGKKQFSCQICNPASNHKNFYQEI